MKGREPTIPRQATPRRRACWAGGSALAPFLESQITYRLLNRTLFYSFVAERLRSPARTQGSPARNGARRRSAIEAHPAA